MEEDVALIHLRRITGWNAPNYNPQEDEYFVEDALWSISRKIRPYELTKQEIECLTISLKKATNKKSAYKIIDNIVNKYLKKISQEQKLLAFYYLILLIIFNKSE